MGSFHKLVYTFLLMTIFQSGYSQVSDCCSFKNTIFSDPALPGQLFRPPGTIDNSTWFNVDWLRADIKMANGEIVRNKEIKYSGLLDVLLWREPESNTIVMLDKAAISWFHFINYKGDTSVYFSRLKVKRDLVADSTNIFGQDIYHGKLSLYVLHTYYIERRDVYAVNGVYQENEIYAEVPVYFFKLQDNRTFGIKKLTRKNLHAIAPEEKDQINMFFRQNKPGKDFDKAELISLAQFLNTIIYK
jgi:hypothetical protein